MVLQFVDQPPGTDKTILNMKLLFAVLIMTSILFCQSKTTSEPNQVSYELVNGWPELSKGYILSQPTGIGIDKSHHIFIFHRAGRKWTTPFPDSLISQHTVLELDNESGKIINSWGANYFIMPHGLTVDKQNNIWLTDVGLHQIFKFSPEGKLLMKLGVAKVPGNDPFVKKSGAYFETAISECIDVLNESMGRDKEKNINRRQADGTVIQDALSKGAVQDDAYDEDI